MRLVPPTPEAIAEAASLIRAGEVVAYPTETVYGLAADPFSVAAVAKLFAVKGRSASEPILLVAANIAQVEEVVYEMSDRAKAYANRFWPGPLSLVLPKAECVPAVLCAGEANVCVRIPAKECSRALCLAFGHPITSTSANKSGGPAPASPGEINLDGVALCIDGGTLRPSLPSTVFNPDTGSVIRHGVIPEALLFDV